MQKTEVPSVCYLLFTVSSTQSLSMSSILSAPSESNVFYRSKLDSARSMVAVPRFRHEFNAMDTGVPCDVGTNSTCFRSLNSL